MKKTIPIFILALVSCTDISPVLCDRNPMDDSSFNELEVSSISAEKIARLFWKEIETKTTADNVTSLISIGNNGRTAYVVNKGDEKGFVIISSSKDYFPIIAFSDKGNFVPSDVWLDVINNEIESCINEAYQNDTLHRTIKYYWQAFENMDSRKTKSSNTFITSSMEEWRREGYSFYSLADGCPDFLSNDEYDDYCEMAIDYNGDNTLASAYILCPSPDYDPDDLSYLIQTEWSDNGLSYSANAISLGQIMKYYQYPTSYPWSSMSRYYVNSATSSFISELENTIDSNYTMAGASATNNCLTKAMDYYGYSYIPSSDFSSWPNDVFNSIIHGYPVLKYARTKSDPNPFAATIIDGYHTVHADRIILKVLSPYSSSPQFETIYSKQAQTSFVHSYFHSNYCGQLLWHPISDSNYLDHNGYHTITPNI